MLPAGADGVEHALRGGSLGRVLQARVRRDVDRGQLVRGEQHERRLGAGQRREQFGVAVEVMAGRVQRRLVERRGDDHGDLPRQRQFDRLHDELVGRLAAGGADLRVRHRVGALAIHMEHRHRAVVRLGRRDREAQAGAEQLVGALEAPEIADHGAARPLRRSHLRQRLDDDLRADAGRVAHGDADHGGCAHVLPFGADAGGRRYTRAQVRLCPPCAGVCLAAPSLIPPGRALRARPRLSRARAHVADALRGLLDPFQVRALGTEGRVLETDAHVSAFDHGAGNHRQDVHAEPADHPGRAGRDLVQQIQVSGQAVVLRRKTEAVVGREHEAVDRRGRALAPVQRRAEPQEARLVDRVGRM